jgi:hypothetical protein
MCIKYRLMNELCPVVLTHILMISKFVIKFGLFHLSEHFPELKLYSTDTYGAKAVP